MGQKAFAVFLQELRDGRTHIELSTALADLLGKVKDTGKAGSIVLEIKVKPAGKGSDVDKVVIFDKVTTKLPAPERGEDFYWLTDDNDLSRNHPKQSTLDLREVPPTAPLHFKEAAQ